VLEAEPVPSSSRAAERGDNAEHKERVVLRYCRHDAQPRDRSELFVSVNTVKTHLKASTGSSTRRAAGETVERAREIGLIG
jgi:nuclear transport factor 2 (NTF2) superfamily protein